MEPIEVVVSRVPGDPIRLTLPGGSNVGYALSEAHVDIAANEEIRVSGCHASPDHVLEDGDRIYILGKVRGN